MNHAANRTLLTPILVVLVLTAVAVTTAFAAPGRGDTHPERDRVRDLFSRYEMLDTVTPLLFGGSGDPAKAPADTVFLLGGPDRWDGRFETPDGQPDWHGWTSLDATFDPAAYWTVTDEPDLVINTNWSLWCGFEYPEPGPIPVPGFGYGNDWKQNAVFTHTVADPGAGSDVVWSLALRHDTEPEWDFVYLQWNSGGQWITLESFDGVSPIVLNLEYEFTVPADQHVGPEGDQIQLRIRFSSDGAWSDEDGFWATERGACQVDDIAVAVGGELVSFTDFEDGQMGDWIQVLESGVGDFTHLRSNLQDLDPCLSNTSWQVNFVDDGVVVPGTGGTPCITWCYGPDGWIVNNTGGLQADVPQTYFIDNLVISPPLAWPQGVDAGRFDFDVYVHEQLLPGHIWPGIFYAWHVRSTASEDPADLEWAEWRNRNFIHFGGPEYQRRQEPIGDLLVEGRRWVQVSLEVIELGFAFGFVGNDGTPAPYFDNVAVRAWAPDGPQIIMNTQELFQDAFPEQGHVDPEHPANNWCRVDNSRAFSSTEQPFVPLDAIRFEVRPHRRHAEVNEAPRLHWVMRCNPLFDDVRPGTPDMDGILRGMVPAGPTAIDGRWWVDLPDTGFFYPGDVLRYYITATEAVAGDSEYQGFSVWPPDTTAITDFALGSSYTRLAEIRALPTLDDAWQQPTVLLWESTTGDHLRPRWLQALADLGLEPDVDVDIYTNRRPGIDIGQGLGGRCTLDLLDGYDALLVAADGRDGLTIGVQGVNFSPDEPLLTAWLDRGGKRVLAVGDHLVSATYPGSPGGNIGPLFNRLGVATLISSDLFDLSGPPRDLQVVAQPGNAVLPPDGLWPLAVGCPDPARIDVLTATGDALTAANLAGPDGQDVGYPAVIARVEDSLANRFLMLPVPLMQVAGGVGGAGGEGGAGGGKRRDATPAERLELLSNLLAWLGVIEGGPTSVPAVHSLQIAAYPNPFNPRTVFAYELPRVDQVQLAVYDLRGQLVRRLVDERQAVGRHEAVWDGRDGAGRAVASGVYFYRFTAGQEQRGGKLTLLK